MLGLWWEKLHLWDGTYGEKFKILKAQKSFGKSILWIRYDSGGEYCSNEFDKFCTHEGTKYLNILVYTPQQNGVDKPMNCINLECARSMLSEFRSDNGL